MTLHKIQIYPFSLYWTGVPIQSRDKVGSAQLEIPMRFSSFVDILNKCIILRFNKIIWKSFPSFTWKLKLKFFGRGSIFFVCFLNFKKTQHHSKVGSFYLWGIGRRRIRCHYTYEIGIETEYNFENNWVLFRAGFDVQNMFLFLFEENKHFSISEHPDFILIHSIFPPEIQYLLTSSFWVSLVSLIWGHLD